MPYICPQCGNDDDFICTSQVVNYVDGELEAYKHVETEVTFTECANCGTEVHYDENYVPDCDMWADKLVLFMEEVPDHVECADRETVSLAS